MALNRFAILDEDHAKFGNLMKKWARLQVPTPGSIAELKAQLEEHDIHAQFPDGNHELKKLSFIWGVADRLDIRLPPAGHLDESEAHLANSEYVLPSFYEKVFGTQPTIDNRLDFHAARIGDYTVANCI